MGCGLCCQIDHQYGFRQVTQRMVDVETFGTKFKVVDPRSLGMTHTEAEFFDHEPCLEAWINGIKAGDLVVDGGAQFGSYTMPALAKGAKVIAYEPMWEAQTVLFLNAEDNGWLESLDIRKACLWDGSEYPPALAKQVFVFGEREVKLCPVMLDNEVPSNMKVNHIKLDIEGAELGAIRGMRRILQHDHPRLFIEDHEGVSSDPNDEVSRYPERVESGKNMRAILESMDYKIEIVRSDVTRRWWVCE